MIASIDSRQGKTLGKGPLGKTCADCTHALGIAYGEKYLWFCRAARTGQLAMGEPISDKIEPTWDACPEFSLRTRSVAA